MKKLINNVATLKLATNEVTENENGDYQIKAVVAHANVVNDKQDNSGGGGCKWYLILTRNSWNALRPLAFRTLSWV